MTKRARVKERKTRGRLEKLRPETEENGHWTRTATRRAKMADDGRARKRGREKRRRWKRG